MFKLADDFKLFKGDCFNILPKFKGEFDLIFADPPYFLSNDGLSIQNGQIVSVNKGEWDKSYGIDEIDKFNLEWLALAKDTLTDNGSVMISGTYHNIFSIGRALQKLDYKILNIITWQKTNPPPNFSCRYLTHSTEQIIWARKSEKFKHIFNYELMKKLNEVARSYIEIAQKIALCGGFKFIWITDGQGWLAAKSKLEEAYKSVKIYNLATLYHFIEELKNV